MAPQRVKGSAHRLAACLARDWADGAPSAAHTRAAPRVSRRSVLVLVHACLGMASRCKGLPLLKGTHGSSAAHFTVACAA